MRTRSLTGRFAKEGAATLRFEQYVERIPLVDCWLWSGANKPKGYGVFTVDGERISAHRFAYQGAYGPIPRGAFVMHSCDTPACVNPAHLRLGSAADNNADRDAKGRHRPTLGEAHGMAKLSVVQVERILRRDESAAVLAKEMGCSKSNIYYIRSGKGWRHVNAPRQLGQALDDLRIMFAGDAA